MDSVEFKMRPTQGDYVSLVVQLFLMSWVFRVYMVVTAAALFISAVVSGVERNGEFFAKVAPLVGFLWVLVCVAGLGLAKRSFKSHLKDFDSTYTVDREGYGAKSETYNIFIKWERFKYIRETKGYWFMKLANRGARLIIFKKVISPQTVSSIKEILADVPVRKKLLSTSLPDGS